MRKILEILIFMAVALAVIYSYWGTIKRESVPFINDIVSKLSPASRPCAEPIPYDLATFDTRFGISQKYFLGAMADAEAIWEKPFGKELFAYVAENTSSDILKVSLVYDYRQQATEKLISLGLEVKDTRDSYDALKAKYLVLKSQYSAVLAEYNMKMETFNKKTKAYENEVTYWNGRGGAPKKEYAKLEAEKSALYSESSEMEAIKNRVNEIAEEINSLVVVLNRLANTLNITVDDYNTIGASRGESFEEGVYSSDGKSREIEIYEFSSREKLVRVLAHELGHALGLEHVEDPKAIMYMLNQGNNSTLTEADLSALKTKCTSM